MKTGAPWRDLHPEFGPWNTVHKRFLEWAKLEVWDDILRMLSCLVPPLLTGTYYPSLRKEELWNVCSILAPGQLQ